MNQLQFSIQSGINKLTGSKIRARSKPYDELHIPSFFLGCIITILILSIGPVLTMLWNGVFSSLVTLLRYLILLGIVSSAYIFLMKRSNTNNQIDSLINKDKIHNFSTSGLKQEPIINAPIFDINKNNEINIMTNKKQSKHNSHVSNTKLPNIPKRYNEIPIDVSSGVSDPTFIDEYENGNKNKNIVNTTRNIKQKNGYKNYNNIPTFDIPRDKINKTDDSIQMDLKNLTKNDFELINFYETNITKSGYHKDHLNSSEVINNNNKKDDSVTNYTTSHSSSSQTTKVPSLKSQDTKYNNFINMAPDKTVMF